MQGLDLNLFFFFREKFRSFDDFEQMSGLWSMFWFKSFRKFFRKIAIFRNFDHWSEILSMSAGRPISQGVCPPLYVGHSFAYVAHFVFLGDVWIRTKFEPRELP
jgi:hypothetical protein